MKFQLTKQDEKYINKINLALNEGESIPLLITRTDHKYYLELSYIDFAKAENFIMSSLMHPETADEVRNILGINVSGLHFANGGRDYIVNDPIKEGSPKDFK